jgi:hypothetical protein
MVQCLFYGYCAPAILPKQIPKEYTTAAYIINQFFKLLIFQIMKKNFKTTVLAIALLVSVSGVFAADVVKALKGQKAVDYSWQKYNRNGLPEGDPVVTEENPFADQCPGGTDDECVIGTPAVGAPIILYYDPL